jgi:hypothetical protein
MAKDRELERLKLIEKLAWEVVKPGSPDEHQAALVALHEALLNKDSFTDRDVRRGAVTLRIIEPTVDSRRR